MNVIKTKVCIIGSGIAGCLCAKFLAQGIDDILVVERGARVTHASRVQNRRHEQSIPTAEHNHIVKGKFKKNIQYVYAMGGTTNLWMGHTPRFLPGDFRVRTLYGITEDWLISYEELEPYYCSAEEEMSIAGADDNKRIPRSQPYPQSPHPFSPADLLVKRCFPEGDVVSLPQARPSSAVGNRPACCGSAVCDLCPVDSKYTPMNSHIPELEKNQAIRFLSETVVHSLVSNGNRHVKRAAAKKKDGSEIMIEAQTFVLAANAVENAAILLRSPTLKQNPHVGKNLFDHPVLLLTAQIKEDGFPNYGYSIATAFCYSFADGPFRSGRASSLALIRNSYPVSDFVRDVAMNHGLRGTALHNKALRDFRNQISLTFMFEDVPNPASCVRIGRKITSLGIPQTEIYYNNYSAYVERSHTDIVAGIKQSLTPLGLKGIVRHDPYFAGHLLGTCKMGNPENGVVDANLRYHPYDNVFILGGSAFPTYSAANPTLTIAALAIRLGSHLSKG